METWNAELRNLYLISEALMSLKIFFFFFGGEQGSELREAVL